jgi:hypothetical protein
MHYVFATRAMLFAFVVFVLAGSCNAAATTHSGQVAHVPNPCESFTGSVDDRCFDRFDFGPVPLTSGQKVDKYNRCMDVVTQRLTRRIDQIASMPKNQQALFEQLMVTMAADMRHCLASPTP